MELTSSRGGRVGHEEITCPLLPQYRHNSLDSRLCRSAGANRIASVCMGSDSGSGRERGLWVTV